MALTSALLGKVRGLFAGASEQPPANTYVPPPRTPYYQPLPDDYVDPFQEYLDGCVPHPDDPTVFFTTKRENLQAIHSPRAAAVYWLRDAPPGLLDDVAGLQASQGSSQIIKDYRYDKYHLKDYPHLRDDLRLIAEIRSEVSGDELMIPHLRGMDTPEDAAKIRAFPGDNSFHSDRFDVGLRAHVTYDGPEIEGLSAKAIERLEAEGINTNPIDHKDTEILNEKLKPEDIIRGFPRIAVGVFKGEGYVSPDPNSPPHIFWRHRGTDRSKVQGLAVIAGMGVNAYETTKYKVDGPALEADF